MHGRPSAGLTITQQPNPLLAHIWQQQLEHRELILNDDVTEDVIEMVTMQIMNFNKEDDEQEAAAREVMGDDYKKLYDREANPITVYIHTDGGSIFDGLSVVSAIKSSRTPVYTVALGKVISMGFIILIVGHRRYAQRYGTLMYHQLLTNPGYQKLRDIEEYAEHCGNLQNILEEIVKEHTLFPQDVLDEIFVQKNDLYMDTAEALEWGVIDEIL